MAFFVALRELVGDLVGVRDRVAVRVRVGVWVAERVGVPERVGVRVGVDERVCERVGVPACELVADTVGTWEPLGVPNSDGLEVGLDVDMVEPLSDVDGVPTTEPEMLVVGEPLPLLVDSAEAELDGVGVVLPLLVAGTEADLDRVGVRVVVLLPLRVDVAMGDSDSVAEALPLPEAVADPVLLTLGKAVTESAAELDTEGLPDVDALLVRLTVAVELKRVGMGEERKRV